MRSLEPLYSILPRSAAAAAAAAPKRSGRPSTRALVLAATATAIALATYFLLVDKRVVPALKNALPEGWRLSDPPLQSQPPPEEPAVKLDGIHALTGHTVHFIGDSVTRYQFIQLQYNWETNLIPTASKPETLIDNKYDPTFQPLWPDWEGFFTRTTDFIAKPSHGFCDCRRTPEWHPTEHIENRYYERRPRNEDEDTAGLSFSGGKTTTTSKATTVSSTRIRFHQYFKDVGVCSLRGRRLGPKDGVRLDKPGDELPDWCSTLPSFIKGLLVDGWDGGYSGDLDSAKQNAPPAVVPASIATATASPSAPLTVVLNCGLHEPLKNETFNAIVDMFAQLSASAATGSSPDAPRPLPPLLVWKTTTPKRGGGQDPNVALRMPTDLPNFRILDTERIVREKFGQASGQHYRDDLHFTADVYQAFNEELARIADEYHRPTRKETDMQKGN
ncbi:hypothetical protein HDU86_000442 [Geranomyces michiganensis]|nr:hypothetical protein HDU86_000442 [Geranomyces michiganensis]